MQVIFSANVAVSFPQGALVRYCTGAVRMLYCIQVDVLHNGHNKANTMKEYIQVLSGVVACLVLLDALAYVAWIVSGQTPVDGFYIGTITAHAVGLFIR